jgi:hypothetical protein
MFYSEKLNTFLNTPPVSVTREIYFVYYLFQYIQTEVKSEPTHGK